MDMRDIHTQCPDCNRRISLPFMQYATIVVRRTCRKCRACFQITAVPKKIKNGYLHFLTLVRL